MTDPHHSPPSPPPIAVVGLACRLPGIDTPQQLRSLLRESGSTVAPRESARWAGDLPEQGSLPPASVLREAADFDADLFGIAPAEAALMDPHQRIALELSVSAIESVTDPQGLVGSRTGVFLAAMSADWATIVAGEPEAAASPYALSGTQRSLVADRVAHAWSLTGPSLVVDTGQSGSLAAVHLACEAIRAGEIDAALAGGIHLNLLARSTETMLASGALAPDGRARVLDAEASGFVRGEGGGLVVLKPLERAWADGDRVHAVLLGSRLYRNPALGGLVQPDAEAQAHALDQVLSQVGVAPSSVGFVELHGTGTPLGDRTEATALGRVFGTAPRKAPLPIASVKSNIGHLEGAAGVLGLIRAVLAIEEAELTPSLGFVAGQPGMDLAGSGLRVQTATEPWPRPEGSAPRVAVVSSLGLGGSNVVAVLAESPPEPSPDSETEPLGSGPLGSGPIGLALSAASPAALPGFARSLAASLFDSPISSRAGSSDPVAIARALGRRPERPHRAFVAASTPVEAAAALHSLGSPPLSESVSTGHAPDRPPRVALVFPGQGGQWAGMGRALLSIDPEHGAFAEHVRACDQVIRRRTGRSVIEAIENGRAFAGEEEVQPALFTVMTSLAHWWSTVAGLRPDAVIGHSQGEVAAAYSAGRLGLDEALHVVLARSTAVSRLPRTHGMASLRLSVAEVEELIATLPDREAAGAGLEIAAVNSPRSTIVAGPLPELEVLAATCERRGLRFRPIEVGYASHSAQVAPLWSALRAEFGAIQPLAGGIPLLSSVDPEQDPALDGDYWWRNLRERVRFSSAIRRALAEGITEFVEVGPHPVLGTAILETTETAEDAEAGPSAEPPVQVVSSMVREEDPALRLLASAGALWCRGVPVDLESVRRTLGAPGSSDRGPVPELPGYSFQRRRHWPGESDKSGLSPHSAGSKPPLGDEAEQVLREVLGQVVSAEVAAAITPESTFHELGIDSRAAVLLRDLLSRRLGLRLPVGFAFDYPNLADATTALRRFGTERREQPAPLSPASSTAPLPNPSVPTSPRSEADPVVVVGMAGRFPGADDLDQLWELLRDGRSSITDFPDDRGWSDLPAQVSRGGFLSSATRFDPRFFGISPREALSMDPQQRVLLEVVWEAYDRWGLDPEDFRGSPTGVFVGAMPSGYGPRLGQGTVESAGYLLTGSTPSVLAGRVAYAFGFTGPTLTVDTACSSSLVALHLARRAILDGETDRAVVGGVCVMADAGIFREFEVQRGLAPDGLCKAYAAGADGTGWSEGCGVLLVERASEAAARGHQVLAVLDSSAINQDGATNGLTAPSGPAQTRLVRTALAEAGLSPEDVDVIEGHGTGTRLGDPIEVQALSEVFAPSPDPSNGPGRATPVLLGSLKSNIGHSQAAAGIGGAIKMILALRHEEIPATLHATEPTHEVDWPAAGVALARHRTPWIRSGPDSPRRRRAGVSAFGISGTNAHIVLSEPPPDLVSGPDPATGGELPMPLLLTAPTLPGLSALGARTAGVLTRDRTGDRETDGRRAACWSTLGSGRHRFSHRAAVPPVEGMSGGLRTLTGPVRVGRGGDRLVFSFSGQGSHRPGAAAALYSGSATYRAVVDRIDDRIGHLVPGSSVRELLTGPADPADPDGWDSAAVQVAVFAHGAALTEVLRRMGVRPDCVLGHSAGEVNAMYAAGILTLDDACRVVSARASVLSRLAPGGMVAVTCSASEAADILGEEEGHGVVISADNGPGSVVLAGPLDDLEAAVHAVTEHGHRAVWTNRRYAFHSPMIDPLVDDLDRAVAEIEHRPAAIAIGVGHEGRIEPAGWTPPTGYWGRHARQRVRFRELVSALPDALGSTDLTVVEVAARTVLGSALRAGLRDRAGTDSDVGPADRPVGRIDASVVTTGTDPGSVTAAVAVVYARTDRGPESLEPGEAGRPAPALPSCGLPSGPFDQARFWIDPEPATAARTPGATPDATGRAGVATPIELPDGTWMLAATLDLDHAPWWADHRLSGRPVLPGAVVLDAALMIGRAVSLPVVEGLDLLAPTYLDEGPVQLRVTAGAPWESRQSPQPGSRDVVVHARSRERRDDGWRLVARGRLREDDAAGQPPLDQSPLDQSSADRTSPAQIYAALSGRGLDYGPQFRRLADGTRIAPERTRATVELSRPVQEADDPETIGEVLDVRLLDAVLQVAAFCGLTDPDGQPAARIVPRRWGRVRTVRPPGPTEGPMVPAGGTIELVEHTSHGWLARIRLTDRDGATLLSGEVEFAVVAGSADPTAGPRLLVPTTVAQESAYAEDGRPFLTLGRISAPDPGHPDRHVADLADLDRHWAGSRSEPTWTSEMATLVEVGAGPRAVDPEIDPEVDLEVERALGLMQEWVLDPRARGRMVFSTQDPRSRPWPHDAVEALVRCANREYPGRFGFISGAVEAPAATLRAALALDHEALRLADGQILADDAEILPDGASDSPLDPRRSVLITGGTGALGRRLARHLVRQHRIRDLVLVARDVTPTEELTALQAELCGPEVDIRLVAADVTETEQVAAAIDEAGRHRPLGAVFHLAGAAPDATLLRTTPRHLGTALAAKATGAQVLDRATAGLDLQAFVMTGSAAGILGQGGQSAYAAANAALAAVARSRRDRGLPGQVVAFGPWAAEDGMAGTLGEVDLARWETRGVGLLEDADGLRLLDEAIIRPEPVLMAWQVVPAAPAALGDPGDPDASPLPAEPARPSATAGSPSRSSGSLAQLVVDQIAQVMRLEPGEVTSGANLWDLGIDSLTALELVDSLGRTTGAELTSTDVFEADTVGDLIARIGQAGDAASESSPGRAPRVARVPTGQGTP